MKTYLVYFNGNQQGKYMASCASQAISKCAADYGTSIAEAHKNFGAYPVVHTA